VDDRSERIEESCEFLLRLLERLGFGRYPVSSPGELGHFSSLSKGKTTILGGFPWNFKQQTWGFRFLTRNIWGLKGISGTKIVTKHGIFQTHFRQVIFHGTVRRNQHGDLPASSKQKKVGTNKR